VIGIGLKHLDFNLQEVDQVGSPALLGILKMSADPDRLTAELPNSADSGTVDVARHIVVELEGILDAERALGLQAALVHHRVVEAPLIKRSMLVTYR
jgi:hypothetical protein